MFVGHALLAFALATLVAEWRGWPARRALALGIATGAFAALPDVDVVYALVAVDPGQLVAGTDVRPGAFWGTASVVHRSATHSLVVAAVAAPAFGLWALSQSSTRRSSAPVPQRRALVELASLQAPRRLEVDLASLWPADLRRAGLQRAGLRLAGPAALVGLVAAATAASGPVAGFVMAAFALGGLAIATLARRSLALSPRAVAVAAGAGLASHPWGDVVTGEPPHLLFPLEGRFLAERVALSADPTLHLLGAFAIELAVVALAALVLARHVDVPLHQLVDRRAALGVAYGAAAVLMVPPTIHGSYQFVGSVLAVGALCGGVRRSRLGAYSLRSVHRRLRADPEATMRDACTALAGIAVAVVSYAVVYLLVG